MGASGATHAGDVQGWDGDGGDIMGEVVPHPKREGGVQGNRASISVGEGVLSCG